ncbi:MAG: NADPH-dependent curcumin reductase CurA [Glaciecola sp.]|jgi:NADPH-dependent curcumin reductase CurA
MTNVNQHHSTLQSVQVNRQWTLATRPVGAPTLGYFNFVESNKPSPQSREILLRTVFLSFDFTCAVA